MENHYEINVSKNGVHLFATAPRSCQSWMKAKELYIEFKQKFPEPEYEITVTKWRAEGHILSPDEILE